MNYSEAVALAHKGDEQGFQFLYEESYKSKYYLALQYMKNKEAAEDVLQDAYMKAFQNLHKLQEPAAFEKWLGVIVANTAKNALVRKNPVLFSDVAVDDEGEEFVYDVEDENPENQPELAYTREETRTLVQELIGSLSEEQKLCVLMFHIEGASISEIAEAMQCSENTVKSRLNYGRKNIKLKAEELQKKGYKLYNIAPVLLLVYLFRLDARVVSASAEVAMAEKLQEETILRNWKEYQSVAKQQENAARVAEKNKKATQAAEKSASIAEHTASNAAKTGFLHTIAGKVIAVVAVAAIAGGAFYGGTQWKASHKEEAGQQAEMDTMPEVPSELAVASKTEDASEASESSAAQEQNATPEPLPRLTEGGEYDFSQFMEGGLTKTELEYVLAYGPEEIPAEGFTKDSLVFVMNSLCQGTDKNGKSYLTAKEWDKQSRGVYDTAEVNRFLSSFTEFQYPGDTVALYISTLNYEASAHVYVTESSGLGRDIKLGFHYHKVTYDDGEEVTDTDKVAILKPTDAGKYRIAEIRKLSEDDFQFETENSEQEESQDTTPSAQEAASEGDIRSLYEGVLAGVQNGQYSFQQEEDSSEYQYFIADINQDNIPELGVALVLEDDNNPFYGYDLRIFTCTQSAGGYQLVEVPGEMVEENLCLAGDGNGLFSQVVSRGNGMVDVYRHTISDGSLTSGEEETSYRIGEKSADDFADQIQDIDWKPVTDLGGLDEIK